MANRRLQPRGQSKYNNAVHGRRESSAPPDDRTINNALARVNLVRCKYNDGPMVIRPWPALDPVDPNNNLLPGRWGINPTEINPWIVRVPVAKYVGLNDDKCERCTFILYEPWRHEECKGNNPYRVLFFAAKQAFDAGEFGTGQSWDPKWNKIMSGGRGRGAELPGPSAMWFMQGFLLANGDKDYVADRGLPMGMDEKDDLVIAQLSSSAGDALVDLLGTPRAEGNIPEGANEETHPHEFMRFGDPTGHYIPTTKEVKGGIIATIFNPKKTKIEGKNSSWNGEIKDAQGYEAAVNKSWTSENREKYINDLDADQVAKVFENWQFWFADEATKQQGILNVPSPEEQCVMLAKAFQSVPELIEYAWSDHEDEFMTEEVRGILRKRRSAVVPGDDVAEDDFDGGPSGRPGKRKTDTIVNTNKRVDDDDDDDEFEEEDEETPEVEDEGDDFEEEDEDAESEVDDEEVEVDDDDEDDEDDEDDDDDDESLDEDDDPFNEEAEIESEVPDEEEEDDDEEDDDEEDDDEFEEAEADEDETVSLAEDQMSDAMKAAKENAQNRVTQPPKKKTSTKKPSKKSTKKPTKKKTKKKAAGKG